MRWMKLEPMIQSEISQKEKHQYSIVTHIYEFRKMVMITLYVRQQKRHRCIEQSFGLCGRGRGAMIRKNGIETYIISYKKRIASPVRCRIQEAWGWCTGMTQRDDMGTEVGGWFRIGNTCTPVADSCQCMAKPIQY